MDIACEGVRDDVRHADRQLLEQDEDAARTRLVISEWHAWAAVLVCASDSARNAAVKCRHDAADMSAEIDAIPTAEHFQQLEASVRDLRVSAAAQDASYRAIRVSLEADRDRLLDARSHREAQMRQFDALVEECWLLAASESAQGTYIDARFDASPESLASHFDKHTAQREAAYCDMVHDVQAAIDGSDDIDAAMLILSDKRNARVEAAIHEAHAFASQLSTAFEHERVALTAAYRLECAKNSELRHHAHRGTHNPRSTQISEVEKRSRERLKEATEEVDIVRSELVTLQKEVHELSKRVDQATLRLSSEAGYLAEARAAKKHSVVQSGLFATALQQENTHWVDTKQELEATLRFARMGYFPDTAVRAKWKDQLAKRRAATAAATATATPTADDRRHGAGGNEVQDDTSPAVSRPTSCATSRSPSVILSPAQPAEDKNERFASERSPAPEEKIHGSDEEAAAAIASPRDEASAAEPLPAPHAQQQPSESTAPPADPATDSAAVEPTAAAAQGTHTTDGQSPAAATSSQPLPEAVPVSHA